MKFENPFLDQNGKIQFLWNPVADKVFILPSPPPEKHGSLIEIPQQFREEYRDNFGILLAVGPGYYDKKGIFHSTSSDLLPGIKVVYDITVPWKQKVKDNNGMEHELILCGTSDILGIVNE